MRNTPPPVINCARVISYAFVDDIEYRKWGKVFSGGELIEKVPNVAICLNLGGEDLGFMVFLCDEEWNTLGICGGKTLEEAKMRVEKNYPTVNERWVDINVSREDALKFYDEGDGMFCDFCEKRIFEIKGECFSGKNSLICEQCIDKLYSEIHDAPQ